MSARRHVTIDAGGVLLPGDLEIPERAAGLVVFAHGSGSSRFSSRNRHVAARLRSRGLATLLFDLLTEPEGSDRANVFDIRLLAGRLEAALDWHATSDTAALPAGLFGASTGAAAALVAAARRPEAVGAVVSRGGRVDMARPELAAVTAATLLIVGAEDRVVLDLNRAAAAELTCPWDLLVVPGAGHLFEEPGALDSVAEAAAHWFGRHLASA